jgi:hypothetical protein
MKAFFNRNQYVFLLLAIAIVGYFLTLIYFCVYDFADEFFPNRYFMLEAIRHGIFPMWLPYQSLGIPIHGDPQSAIFYLPLWVLALFGNYNPICWSIETIFHVFMAGWGMLLLTRQFTQNSKTSFVIGCCYMFCGVMIGNMQHFSWIIAVTWIPWIICYSFTLFENPTCKNALWLAFFASLLFTGGYPGFCFIIITLFAVLLIHYLIRGLRQKNWVFLRKLSFMLLFTALVCLLLSMPSFISYLEAHQYTVRGEPLPYDKTIYNRFTPQCIISLIFPYICCSESFIGTDISMASIFVGVLTLFFAVAGIRHVKESRLKITLYWCLACFLLSFGSKLPFYKWTYYTVPFFNMMRYSAIFRIFTIIGLLILAALGLDKVLHDFSGYRKKLSRFLFVTIIIAGIVAVISVIACPQIIRDVLTFNRYNLLNSSIYHKLWLESVLLLTLFIPLWIALFFKNRFSQHIMLISLILNLILSGYLCMTKTGIDRNHTNKTIHALLHTKPENYPVPVEVTTDQRLQGLTWNASFWRSLGIYDKQIEWNSYNPFKLKTHNLMLRPYHQHDTQLTLPVIAFFPKEVIYSDAPLPISVDTAYTSERQRVVSYRETDTPQLHIRCFDPGKIIIQTNTDTERDLIICQNYYKKWTASMENDTPVPIFPLNTSMMTLKIPAGEHTVTLCYQRHDLLILFIIQMITTVLLFGKQLKLRIRNRRIIHYS